MRAVVVYESLWGNTEAVARAIVEGMGTGAQSFSTAQATNAVVAVADLLVVGSPVLGFTVPSEKMVESIRTNPTHSKHPPETTQPSMRAWLEQLAEGAAASAAFETRIWWSPGGAIKHIEEALSTAGFRPVSKGERFIVEGQYGPLKPGELDRAREWGKQLVDSLV